MWLFHFDQTDGVAIKHARNGREYRLPELPQFSVDVYSEEANTVYKFFWCYFHGCTCQRFRDVITTNGDNLAARYEQTMGRLEQIIRAEHHVNFQWECEFDKSGIATQVLLAHPTVCTIPCVPRTLCIVSNRGNAPTLYCPGGQEFLICCRHEPLSVHMQLLQFPGGPSGHPCGRRLQRQGSLKCSIVPPERLYHHVLPFIANQ